jgi:hypothetical protein
MAYAALKRRSSTVLHTFFLLFGSFRFSGCESNESA